MLNRFAPLVSIVFSIAFLGAAGQVSATTKPRPVIYFHPNNSGSTVKLSGERFSGDEFSQSKYFDSRYFGEESTAGAPVNKELAQKVLSQGYALQGTRYAWGGSSLSTGFDCSGFVGYVFRKKAGIQLPRTSQEMIQLNAPVVKRDSLKPGDVIFFNSRGRGHVNHVGIYAGNNTFIHSPNSRAGGVRVDSLGSSYWSRSYVKAKRLLAMAPSSVARN